jgi:hypothetical protein
MKKVLCFAAIHMLFIAVGVCKAQTNIDSAMMQMLREHVNRDTLLNSFATHTFWEYGQLSLPSDLAARNTIERKWKINHIHVAGCMVTQQMRDTISEHNKAVRQQLLATYGEDWERRFEKEIRVEKKKEKKVRRILNSLDFIKYKQKQVMLNNEVPRSKRLIFSDKWFGDYKQKLNYKMTPIENSSEYNVAVRGYTKINNKDAYVTFYTMTVNYETKAYKILNDKMEHVKSNFDE